MILVAAHIKTSTEMCYLPMNEGSGEPHDSSGFNNVVANYGASWVTGSYGRAMSFDGINDYVDCGTDVRLQPTDTFAIGLWIKPALNQEYCYDTIEGNYGLAGVVDGANSTTYWSWQLRYGSADACSLGLQVNTAAGGKWVTLGYNLPTATWSYILASFDRDIERIYVDGVLKDTNNFTATTITTNAATKLMFGVAGWGVSNTYYEGLISRPTFYNLDPPVADILSYYNTTKGIYGL